MWLQTRFRSETRWATFHLMTGPWGTFGHWLQPLLLAVQDLFVKPCPASFAPECIRNPVQTLRPISIIRKSDGERLANAVSAWGLAIAFCSELVALITSSADSSSDWPRRSLPIGSSVCQARPIRMLAVFVVVISVNLGVLVNIDLMLELLEGVLRAVCECVQARVHVIRRNMLREHAAGGQGVVRRKPVKRVGKHVGGRTCCCCFAEED